jgi:AI-2 transport protein TqsA
MLDTTTTPEGSILRPLIGAAALMIIIAGLRAAQPVLVPLALAAFLVVTSLPVQRELKRLGVPSVLSIAIVLLMILGLLVGVVAIALNSIMQIRDGLPTYVARFGDIYAGVLTWLVEHRVMAPEAAAEIPISPLGLLDLVTGFARGIVGFISLVFLVALITLFLLAEAGGVPRKLRTAMGREDADLNRYGRVMNEIQRYLAIKTATSMSTGILVGVWALVIGLDFPLFWGLTAFLLNYIPTIGSLVAAVPAVLLALVQLGPGGAVLTAVGYLVVNIVIGNLIEPAVMGRGLGLSPFVILIALLFWGWAWGPVGMLLALPLTMVVKILLENTRDLAWVSVLMGPAWDQRAHVLKRGKAPRRRAEERPV